jgi:Domain of unknown function (DUF1707)
VRLSDSDREVLFEKLGRHAAAGRLDIEELERRVAAIVAAQTSAQAAEVMADLPPLPGATVPGRPRRGRGHGDAAAPAVDWRPTGERFRDPRTNRVMRVWEDSSGGRHYVAEDES